MTNDSTRPIGGASPAGMYRGDSTAPKNEERCNKLWEEWRRAVSAEEHANNLALAALQALNVLNERAVKAAAAYASAENNWKTHNEKFQQDLPNIEAARKEWRDVASTLTSGTGITDWDKWNREKERLTRAEDLAARYSTEEFEALFQKMSSAAQQMETIRVQTKTALANVRTTQEQWERARQHMESAMAEYQSRCGSAP